MEADPQRRGVPPGIVKYRFEFFFAWYDFWVGMYVARGRRPALYICLFPCCVIKVTRRNRG